MGEDDNNPNQMLHSHLGPSKELAVKRLPMLPRQFSFNSGQGQQGDGGQAEGSGFGTSMVIRRPSFTETSITFALLETGTCTCSAVNFHQVGTPRKAAGY